MAKRSRSNALFNLEDLQENAAKFESLICNYLGGFRLVDLGIQIETKSTAFGEIGDENSGPGFELGSLSEKAKNHTPFHLLNRFI
jgi:hypothetical protein